MTRRHHIAVLALTTIFASASADAARQCTVNHIYEPSSTLSVPEDGRTLAEADLVQMSEDGQEILLQGKVMIIAPEQRLSAEQIRYQLDEERIYLEGGIRADNPDLSFKTDAPAVLGPDYAQIEDTHFALKDSALNGSADRLSVAPTQITLHNTQVSACPPDERIWRLVAEHIELDRNTGAGQARNVTLKLGDTSVLYTPWLGFNTSGQRQTGILAPTLRYHSTHGSSVEVPWYWNIARDRDATFSTVLSTDGTAELVTQWRYLAPNGLWVLDLSALSDESLWQGRLRADLQTQALGAMQLDWTLNDETDYAQARLAQGFDDEADLAPRRLTWQHSAQQHRAQVAWVADLPQGTSNGSQDSLLIQALPRAEFAYATQYSHVHLNGHIGFEALNDADDIRGQRQWVNLSASRNFALGPLQITPQARLAHTRQSWTTTYPSGEVNRASLSLDAQGSWTRPTDAGGRQTLEPHLQWIARSEGGDLLRHVDHGQSTASYSTLFSEHTQGLDRFADSDQLNAGVQLRNYAPDGSQTWRVYAGVRETLEAEDSGLSEGDFHTVIGTGIQITEDVEITASHVTYDSQDDNHANTVALSWSDTQTRLAASLNQDRYGQNTWQIDGSKTFDNQWQVAAHWQRRDATQTDEVRRLSAAYENCCLRVGGYVTQELLNDTQTLNAGIQLELTGLGGAGAPLDRRSP